MENDLIIAALGGLAGTTVMTGMMLLGKRMGLPAVDAHGILGFVLSAERAHPIGYIAHWLMGAAFGVGYALVFRAVPGNPYALGTSLGVVHWLIVGWMFGFAPLVHAGMKAGTVPVVGPYMLRSLGFTGFIAGMIGHIAFGLTVTLIYILLGGHFAA
jgi:hypothetical protein